VRGSDLKQLFLKHVGQTSDGPMAIDVKSATGCTIIDSSGKNYLDFISGISVASFGHSHPQIVKAVQVQAGKFMHTMVYGEHVQSPQVLLAKELTEELGGELNSVYFVNSGSEAIEAALKLSKRATGRYETISFEGAYHGSTHGALSLMGGQDFSNGYLPVVPGNTVLPYGLLSSIDHISHRHAAVVVEVVQSESGYRLPHAGFLKALERKCLDTGTLLIIDEIQTGFGRSGPLFAYQDEGIQPDIVAMAKAMGGGMPIGAIAASRSLMNNFTNNPVLGHITTFGGHPVSCASSLAALKIWKEEIPKGRTEQIELKLRQLLADIPNTEISGKGAMLALHLGSTDRMWKNVKKAWDKGLLIDWFLFNESAFRIAPPLIITDEELEHGSQIIHEILID
jgi:acetylornithine/succinyldiaminopimelate/putrescine aminotransferase